MYLVAAFAAGALLVGVTVFFSGSALQGNLSNPFLPSDKQACSMTACTALKNAMDYDKVLRKDINSLSAMLSDVNNNLQSQMNLNNAVKNNFEAQFTEARNRLNNLEQIANQFAGYFTKTNTQLKVLGQPGLW